MDPSQKRSCKMCDIVKKVEEGKKEKTESCLVKEKIECPKKEEAEAPPVEEPPKEDKCKKDTLVQKKDPCNMCKIISDMDPDKPKEPPKKEPDCKLEPPKKRDCQMCQIIKKIEIDKTEKEPTEGCDSTVLEEKEEIQEGRCQKEVEKPPEEKCMRQVKPDDSCTKKRWAKDIGD